MARSPVTPPAASNVHGCALIRRSSTASLVLGLISTALSTPAAELDRSVDLLERGIELIVHPPTRTPRSEATWPRRTRGTSATSCNVSRGCTARSHGDAAEAPTVQVEAEMQEALEAVGYVD